MTVFTYAECRLIGLIAFLPRIITAIPMDLLCIGLDCIPGRLASDTSHERISVFESGREKRQNSACFALLPTQEILL